MDVIEIIGRILIGGLFLLSGLNHFTKMDSSVAYARSKRVPLPRLAVIITGLMLVFGGATLLIWKLAGVGALVLIVFLVLTSFIMHNFWAQPTSEKRMMEMHYWMGNMMLAGTLAIILSMIGF